ncbi:MAG: protein-L-isoaspartate(D-aspartate) O-methyltransferase [Bacteroidales bacterium]|jgi:protein-L-isoaspartate(D-aspartate) O-methyltransferase|nr:protein-L-isoaspartate(D-aspartate) O-methyltransferase [Bacteroidales bacterium]
MEDTYRHKGLRRKLVEEIRKKGITDERVLDAIGKIPRHAFITDSALVEFAYRDAAFPINAGQTISQPYTVAFQTQLLQVQPHEKVLEIGTGSGYQGAVLFELSARVYTIERQRELHLKAQQLLGQLGYKLHFFYGDGYAGLPAYAPFDKILVTAGATEMPETLLQQLKTGGRMVIPVGDSEQQEMILVEKLSDGKITVSKHGTFAFVPFLKGKS